MTCTSSALAAQQFRLFVLNAQRTWVKAVGALSEVSKAYAPSVKSLCTFIKPDFQVHTVKDYASGSSKTVLNRLRQRLTKRNHKETERKTRTPRSGPACNCPDCGKSFFSPYFLRLHLKNSGTKEACLHCGAVLLRGHKMREHLDSVHGETLLLCKQCPMLLGNEIRMQKHVEKAHSVGAPTCNDCGRWFPGKTSLEVHSQMHAVRTCRTCEKQFTNRSCYRAHRSKCEPDARPNAHQVPRNKRSNIRDPATFTCDYCGKSYLSRPQLKNHIVWIHMDVRPHQCQWCGKRFYTPSRLAEHTIVHTRERNFACDICGAKLVTKMAAIYHRRRHTGEKPYECEDCGEGFISSSRRSEHAKRRHGKGPKINCMQCPASFVRGHELKRHMEKSHRSQGQNLSNVVQVEG